MAIITTNASGDDYFDVFQTSFVPANPTIVANAAEFSYTVPGSSPGLSKPSYAIHTMLAGSGFSYGADPDDGPVGGSIRAFYSYTTSTGPRQPPPPLPPKTWEDVYIETSPFAIDTRNAPLSLPAGFQFDSTDLFWRTMLSGEDTIDLKLRTVPVFAGDGRDIAVGAPAVGAKDVFTVSYAAASIVPDDGLPTPSLQAPEVYGDFRVVLIRATAYGGDDTINWVTAAGDGSFITPGQVSGDVRDVGQSLDSSKGGTLFGGNDTIDLGGAATGTDVTGDVFNVWGTSQVSGGNDWIVGSAFSDFIYGDARGVAGGASVTGGHDTLFGMDGDDSIYGDHSGLPSAVIGGNDTLDGGAGDDFLEGGGGHDTLIGGKDTDDQYGEDGDDTFLIESPDDYTPDEIIDGGPGNDRLRFTSQVGGQTLVLRPSLAGVEFVEVSDSGGDASGTMALNIDGSSVGYGLDIRGNAGANILTGTDFADTLTGGEGVDSLIGGDGDDTLYLRYDFPVEDGEVLDGGDGNDTLHMHVAMYQDFRGAEINSVEALFFQPDSSYGMKALFNANQFLFGSVKATGHNYPVLVSVFMEDLTALDLSTLTGLDTLNNPGDGFEVTGDGDSETITGSILADTLGGNSGSDIFLIRAPGDHPATEAIDGGAGTDRIRFTSATEGQTLVLSSLVTNVEVAEISNAVGNASSTVALNLDASALGSGLQFFGNAGANTLTGTGFGDAMDGYTGADILLGGVGDDVLTGGEGGDFLDGGKDDDTLYGNEGVDTLIGGLGNDMLDGGAVDDPATQGNFLLGGDGDDTYLVRNTFDLVDEGYVFANAGFGGRDTVISSANWFWDVYGIGETIQIAEDAEDPTGAGTTIVGGVFDNVLVGNAATNILFGRGGSDTYRAGDGVDFISLNLLGVPTSLYSGVDGHNTIVVEQRKTGPVSYDIVFDFDPTRDKANVSDYAAVNGFVSGADVMARAVNDGAGNCYIALGDGLDYLYMVGLETDDLNATDFIV